MAVDKLPMPTASSVDFARARPSTICREEEEERARRGALSTTQFSNTVIVGSLGGVKSLVSRYIEGYSFWSISGP